MTEEEQPIDPCDVQLKLYALTSLIDKHIDARRHVTVGETLKLLGPVFDALKEHIAKSIDDGLAAFERQHSAVLDGLEQRISLLELNFKKLPALLDAGVWHVGATYSKGACVTHDGSLWIAQNATGDKPGTSPAFRLAVKRGRDGKDLKSAS